MNEPIVGKPGLPHVVVAAVIDDCLESVALALEAGVRDQDMRTAVLDTVKDYLSREW